MKRVRSSRFVWSAGEDVTCSAADTREQTTHLPRAMTPLLIEPGPETASDSGNAFSFAGEKCYDDDGSAGSDDEPTEIAAVSCSSRNTEDTDMNTSVRNSNKADPAADAQHVYTEWSSDEESDDGDNPRCRDKRRRRVGV